MTSQADQDEAGARTVLSELRATNLQLQATIDQLRVELENRAAHTAAAVQQAQASFTGEVNQLMATVQKMRDQLEE